MTTIRPGVLIYTEAYHYSNYGACPHWIIISASNRSVFMNVMFEKRVFLVLSNNNDTIHALDVVTDLGVLIGDYDAIQRKLLPADPAETNASCHVGS